MGGKFDQHLYNVALQFKDDSIMSYTRIWHVYMSTIDVDMAKLAIFKCEIFQQLCMENVRMTKIAMAKFCYIVLVLNSPQRDFIFF